MDGDIIKNENDLKETNDEVSYRYLQQKKKKNNLL